MAEPHPAAELDQAGVLRGHDRVDSEPDLARRPPQQRLVPDGLCCGDQQQPSSVVGEQLELPQEALLDPGRQRSHARELEPARELGRRQTPRQLEERERVPT